MASRNISTWSHVNKSPNMRIIGDDETQVTNVGDDEKWQAIRATNSFNSGRCYFDIIVTRSGNTANTWKFCIGVCGEDFDCNHAKKWIGAQGSWSIVAGTGGICHDGANGTPYGPPILENDVVRVLLDFVDGTISFARNGINYGVAFTNLRGPVYPAISFTGKNSVVQLKVPVIQPAYPLTATVVGDQIIDWDLSGWDALNISENLAIENIRASTIVKNNGSEEKWQCARSKTMFSEGRCYFEFIIIVDSKTTNTWRFCLGVCPPSFDVRSKQKKWVGSQGSWGYAAVGETCNDVASGVKYGMHYKQDDVIGVTLDFNAKTIEYSINGRSQGIAFTNLRGPVYAAASFTGTGSKVYLRSRKNIISNNSIAPSIIPNPVPAIDLAWDPQNCSTFLQIDPKQPNLFKNSGSGDKWQVVTSKQTFSVGKVIVDMDICLPKASTTNTWVFCLGVVPVLFNANSTQKWLGSQSSWGYIGGTGGVVHNTTESIPYHQPYTFGDTISVHLDFSAKTIGFAKNGESPGVAFRNLVGPVKIAASVTTTGSTIRIRYPNATISASSPVAISKVSSTTAVVSSQVAVAAPINPNLELECEYRGLLFALIDKQKVTPDEQRMLSRWKLAHESFSDDIHLRTLSKLGLSKEKFDSYFSKDDVRDDDLCCICMDALSDIAFRPCGHLKVCSDCSVSLQDCPFCRKKIVECFKIFR